MFSGWKRFRYVPVLTFETIKLSHLPRYLVNHGGLEVDEDCPRDVLARWGLGKEGVEGVVGDSQGVVGRHLAIGHDPCS